MFPSQGAYALGVFMYCFYYTKIVWFAGIAVNFQSYSELSLSH